MKDKAKKILLFFEGWTINLLYHNVQILTMNYSKKIDKDDVVPGLKIFYILEDRI